MHLKSMELSPLSSTLDLIIFLLVYILSTDGIQLSALFLCLSLSFVLHLYHLFFLNVNTFSPTTYDLQRRKKIENGDTNVNYLVIKLYIIYMKKNVYDVLINCQKKLICSTFIAHCPNTSVILFRLYPQRYRNIFRHDMMHLLDIKKLNSINIRHFKVCTIQASHQV